jgi:glycosyltransferase involved in cell wall biosynthesis
MPTSERGLVLDLVGTQSLDYGDRGVARYVEELAKALLDIPALVRGLLLNPTLPFPGLLHHDLLRSPLLGWNTAPTLRRILVDGPVAYHVMSPLELGPPPATVLPPHVLDADVPIVATLYDLIPLLRPDDYLQSPDLAARWRLRSEIYRRAGAVLALSASVRDDAVRLLGVDDDRISVIGGGVSSHFRPAPPGSDAMAPVRRALPGIRRDFVLYVGGTDRRKNVDRLIEAYASLPSALRAKYQLVVACRLDDRAVEDRWRALIETFASVNDVALTDHVSDDLLRDLYRAATLHVFPSEHEGFGLPVAEAIACGCPTIVSNAGSLPEILDHPAATFDPTDTRAITDLMGRALNDSAFLEELRGVARARAPQWTWNAVAARTVTALDRLPPPSTTRQRQPSLRIALVGALPPSTSPAASAGASLAEALAPHCHLDLYSDDRPDQRWLGELRAGPRLPVLALRRTGAFIGYDAVIHNLGNSDDELDVLESALTIPGILWLHSLNLVPLYRRMASRCSGDAHAWLAATVRDMYADRVPSTSDPSGLDPEVHRYGLLMTSAAVRGARAVIVNDDASARRLLLDQGARGPAPRVIVASTSATDTAPRVLNLVIELGGPVAKVA